MAFNAQSGLEVPIFSGYVRIVDVPSQGTSGTGRQPRGDTKGQQGRDNVDGRDRNR